MGLFDFLKKKPDVQEQEEIMALDKGLEKTKTGLITKMSRAVLGKSKVD
jgi:fused signal recognition particle receptor